MGSEHYCLRWNNHQSNLLGVFSQLLHDQSLVDVTLACAEGLSIRAHKVVLSACSSYFQTLFLDHPNRHPIVILKDVHFAELRTLVEFMYKGEAHVEYCQLSALLKTAESLKVKGLVEMTNINSAQEEKNDNSNEQKITDSTSINLKNIAKTIISDDPENSQPPTSVSPSPTNQDQERNEDICDEKDKKEDRRPEETSSASVQRVSSQKSSESLPGPSEMPPVQQFPLSLKKEAEWDRNFADDKSTAGESSSEFRHQQESETGDFDCKSNNSYTLALSSQRDCSEIPLSTSSSRSSTPFQFPFPSLTGFPGPSSSSTAAVAAAAASASVVAAYESENNTRSNNVLVNIFQQKGLIGLDEKERTSTFSMFRCTICLAAFPSIWLLEQHTNLQHSNLDDIASTSSDEKPFKCEQCGQSYRYRSAYLKHREQNHRARLPADKLFTCDVCGMQFRYLKSFKKHRLNHALEKLHSKTPHELLLLDAYSRRNIPESTTETGKPSSVSCVNEKVSATTTSASQAENSSDQVSSSNEAFAGTENPSGSNQRKSNNPISKEQHPNFYKFSLDDYYCGVGEIERKNCKSSRTPGSEQDETIDSLAYALSLASSSQESADNPKKSNTRNSTSLSVEGSIIELLRLEASGMSVNVDGSRDRRFACPFCGKCVRSKENLKLHVRKHTGERPFVCLFCGRAFGGKSDLTRHLRIHTGERPYHCEMCGKCFARADYLSKHLTTHIHNSQR